MRIGIISDVHGDYGALETTLNKMKNEHQVSRILCAGDLVGRGPEQNRVVEAVHHNSIITVRGNHDEWFYGISSENTDYLKTLPLDWEGKLGGLKVFMCHGKPGNNMWGMYRDHLSETYLKMANCSDFGKRGRYGTSHKPSPNCLMTVNPVSSHHCFHTCGTWQLIWVLSLPIASVSRSLKRRRLYSGCGVAKKNSPPGFSLA